MATDGAEDLFRDHVCVDTGEHAELTLYELTLFLRNTRGTQSAEELAAMLMARYWILRRD